MYIFSETGIGEDGILKVRGGNIRALEIKKYCFTWARRDNDDVENYLRRVNCLLKLKGQLMSFIQLHFFV